MTTVCLPRTTDPLPTTDCWAGFADPKPRSRPLIPNRGPEYTSFVRTIFLVRDRHALLESIMTSKKTDRDTL